MILSTTPNIEGRRIRQYCGIVSGEAIMGANIVRDFFASIRDVVGGRSGSYEEVIRKAKNEALDEMQREAMRLGADAILSIDIDYETIGTSMLMVAVSGTAVILE
ncbi:hypothetical protein HR17_06260 [Porphyromonas gulae]|uniref:UPF0145 protein HR15_05340 n=1 Tax=Porphyromonas gulae TaxID=111105 RepID=A0A099WRG4_9PORP|nr:MULTISPECIES: heavy metal-binding domain-containing protein [Porphyromonas]KGL47118.1 hypothetical protein HQ49_09580 [Porphyromonas gulae]KGL55737.1 hypothetical protein HQ50_05190 [Porphyromonas sp. COT-052 OH4946]KGN73838.1 hypothetical protein HR17_06260 [Porphyromonas gulae]KGN88023.1 hypothetical protein HR15_05340 [Porphyromonas gulae]KGO04808.1 hypothetical protein HR16_03160 [Porphyromonas gulae]